MAGSVVGDADVAAPAIPSLLRQLQASPFANTTMPINVALQPVVHALTGAVVGHEALSRFPEWTPLTVAGWFDLAWNVGVGEELELAAAYAALNLPYSSDSDEVVFVNLAGRTLLHAQRVIDLVDPLRWPGVIVEVTETQQVDDYGPVRETLTHLRSLGARVAIDDYGAGHSIEHYTGLAGMVDIIKVDRALLNHVLPIDFTRDRVTRQRIAEAEAEGLTVLAEAVETAEEAARVRDLGFHLAQGFYFGHPELVVCWSGDVAVLCD